MFLKSYCLQSSSLYFLFSCCFHRAIEQSFNIVLNWYYKQYNTPGPFHFIWPSDVMLCHGREKQQQTGHSITTDSIGRNTLCCSLRCLEKSCCCVSFPWIIKLTKHKKKHMISSVKNCEKQNIMNSALSRQVCRKEVHFSALELNKDRINLNRKGLNQNLHHNPSVLEVTVFEECLGCVVWPHFF